MVSESRFIAERDSDRWLPFFSFASPHVDWHFPAIYDNFLVLRFSAFDFGGIVGAVAIMLQCFFHLNAFDKNKREKRATFRDRLVQDHLFGSNLRLASSIQPFFLTL